MIPSVSDATFALNKFNCNGCGLPEVTIPLKLGGDAGFPLSYVTVPWEVIAVHH